MRIDKKPGPAPGWIILLFATALAILLTEACSKPRSQASAPAIGPEELWRLDLLPRLRRGVKVGCVSSYDRSGDNDDGFSGAYSFIRKEEGGLVIAELQGPGVITRIQLPSPTDEIIEFYFDGEPSPRIRRLIPELFDGTHAPFLSPLVGAGAGGRYSYVPLPFEHSCKILVKTEKYHFYQINYAQFPEGTVVPTYQEPANESFRRWLDGFAALLSSAGPEISASLVPEGTELKTYTVRNRLESGRTLTLFKTSRPGRIVGLRLGPAATLAGKERDIVLRIFWDGAKEPAVVCPVGDFFGASFGEPAARALLLGTSEDTDYIYFPMPFERSARVELFSERTSGPALEVWADVVIAPLAKSADEGRFYARWRRENPTAEGTPFTYLRTTGRGHVVGAILQAQGMEPGQTPFFEGDDRAVIDGELAIPGTGSEDSFNGGWYDVPGRWETRTSFPLSGCLDYKKPLGRTGGYRWMIPDAYSYEKSMDYTIEHGPAGNKVPTDYTAVTFFYSLDPPPADPPLPPVAARRVSDPPRIVFVPGWNVPIHSTSLQNATLAKVTSKIGETGVRHLSLRTSGLDIFGHHHIAFSCEIPSAGSYEVGIKAVQGPDQGIVQMFRNDIPAGDPINLWAEERKLSPVLRLGRIDLGAGNNLVFFHLVGKDERSKGLGLDLVEIVFERVH